MKNTKLSEMKRTYNCYKDCYEMWDQEGRKYNIFKYAIEIGTHKFRFLKCKYFGHTWRHHVDIGPDSGSESHDCTYCGESHSHTYY